jgi:hypothetical protein
MREFLGFAFGFPTALFSFSLLVIAGYWLLVLAGGLGVDTLDGEGGDSGGFQGVLAAGGLGGVPVSVVVSLLVAVGWFASLTGSVLIDGTGGAAAAVLGFVVLLAALVAGWSCTRVLVLPLRRVFRDGSDRTSARPRSRPTTAPRRSSRSACPARTCPWRATRTAPRWPAAAPH